MYVCLLLKSGLTPVTNHKTKLLGGSCVGAEDCLGPEKSGGISGISGGGGGGIF